MRKHRFRSLKISPVVLLKHERDEEEREQEEEEEEDQEQEDQEDQEEEEKEEEEEDSNSELEADFQGNSEGPGISGEQVDSERKVAPLPEDVEQMKKLAGRSMFWYAELYDCEGV